MTTDPVPSGVRKELASVGQAWRSTHPHVEVSERVHTSTDWVRFVSHLLVVAAPHLSAAAWRSIAVELSEYKGRIEGPLEGKPVRPRPSSVFAPPPPQPLTLCRAGSSPSSSTRSAVPTTRRRGPFSRTCTGFTRRTAILSPGKCRGLSRPSSARGMPRAGTAQPRNKRATTGSTLSASSSSRTRRAWRGAGVQSRTSCGPTRTASRRRAGLPRCARACLSLPRSMCTDAPGRAARQVRLGRGRERAANRQRALRAGVLGASPVLVSLQHARADGPDGRRRTVTPRRTRSPGPCSGTRTTSSSA
ncbi:hypothetical protein DMC30DRAFT_165476 [Rhodotorula diobovata]|uniref:Uncharacterized protein n=1 Tax=Rhodotorula diobovata TaxID=5288 RepID=A0A5C5G5I0_9BASI|nr:hypothetical protein DMC30DRAFT_165476 [Rhodotorula diobovata]